MRACPPFKSVFCGFFLEPHTRLSATEFFTSALVEFGVLLSPCSAQMGYIFLFLVFLVTFSCFPADATLFKLESFSLCFLSAWDP